VGYINFALELTLTSSSIHTNDYSLARVLFRTFTEPPSPETLVRFLEKK
jgi:phosphoribosylaminoimidazole (AIR) synthetase